MLALRILAAAWCLPLAPFHEQSLRRAPPAYFEVFADTGPQGVATLGFGARERERLSALHAAGQPFRLRDMPLPGRLRVELDLRPVSAMPAGARAQVVGADGRLALLAPRVRCFSGRVVGGGSAFLAATERELHGYFHAGDELYFLSTGPETAGRALLAHSSQLGTLEAGGCGFASELLPAPPVRELALTTPALRMADVFVEADNAYRGRFLSDQDCVDYTVLLFTAASEIYRRDIGTRLRIPDRYLRVWNTTPPWGAITGYPHLKNVYTWWQSSQNVLRSWPRAAVHVLTNPIFGGTARGVDGLCSSVRAYEISSVSGRFPYPRLHTDRYNWDLFVVCHELGHTFGSPHSALYSPPIQCTDGSGPDNGTLMSYCHVDNGIARVGMRFHLREQQRIRSVMETSCFQTTWLQPGDYDGDGSVGPTDLAALEEVLGQGFRSLAAEEVFDLDASGKLDELDRLGLAELSYGAPPAIVAERLGTGVNPSCLEALGNPVLGRTWRARVLASGVGATTLLVGYDLPLAGPRTVRGELLVMTAPFGGTKLFSSTALSDGIAALHELPLPLDPALYGLPVSFQGLVLDGPSGEQYCNALDVVLSPYE